MCADGQEGEFGALGALKTADSNPSGEGEWDLGDGLDYQMRT